jgi:signal transduction histidine kinase
MDKEQRYYDPQSLLNAQPVMVAVIDPDTYTVQFQNDISIRKLGDVSGRKCYETIAACPVPCTFCRLPEAMKTGRVTENEIILSGNQSLLVQWSKAVMQDGRAHIIETITDITARKRLEDQASRAEKMDALSRLAGGMAHDINNLLTVIMGASDHLAGGTGLDESSVQRLRTATDRAAAITRQLVAFSHHQQMQLQAIDLSALCSELESRIRALAGKGVSVEFRLNAGPNPVIADRRHLEDILAVLVSNAREAMPGRGSLILATMTMAVGPEEAGKRGLNPGIYARLTIRDTGCGMSKDLREHLFEPFYLRTRAGTGHGLGLASVYGMVRQMGGHIEVTSDCGIGTEFAMLFPCFRQMAPTRACVSAVPPTAAHPTILLVEDDEDVRMAVADMLREAGYDVRASCDGLDALEHLRAMASPPALVLTDVMMPRMTGPQLAMQIEGMMPGVRLLYMSGYSDEILEPLDGKLRSFIAKPFRRDHLIRQIREALSR